MSTNWIRRVFATAALAAGFSAQAAAPNAAMLTNSCSGCHGVGGTSAGVAMPSLAGQRKEYFVAAMNGYRSGARPSTVMGRLATAYSDADIAAMGDFYAAQKPARQSGPVDAKLAEKGRTLFYKQCRHCHLDNRGLWETMHQRGEYDRQCGNCHKKSGPDAKDDIPVIAGQWLNYLQVQLSDFKSGKRRMSESKAQKLKPLSREELEAIAHYCASETPE